MSGQDEKRGVERHRIPAIDRMVTVLEMLERRPGGATLKELVGMAGLPRSTMYRLLNSLETHEIVSHLPGGLYRLGPRLLRFSASVSAEAARYDLAAIAMPHLERLSHKTGEGSRIAVLDKRQTLVLATAQGTREFARTAVAGQHLPVHAGAASKVLLASLPPEQRLSLIEPPLRAFTSRTLTDPHKLDAELNRIRRQGWSRDKGEFSPNVHAFAAPVFDEANHVVAAISVAFLAGKSAEELETIRRLVVATAEAIGAEVLGLASASTPSPPQTRPATNLPT